MSWSPCPDPVPGDRASAEAIEMLIVPRAVDLGEMQVRRALPSVKRQMVGPFIFFDQMGPAEFLTDQGIDVRPHPHINLATVTYLFEGQILHRDSLGTEKTIEPGAVNWMRAGRGIVHSERTSPERRRSGQRLFGIQTWMALPDDQEESEPAFVHHSADDLPTVAAEALAGLGIAYLPEDYVREHIASGRLVRVLSDWTPPSSGYHLYYPKRRQPARAFSVLVDALRYR